MEAPDNSAVGGSTMLGAGPEYCNNIDAPNNCVGGSESQCARPFLFAQQNRPHTSNLISIFDTAAFPGLGRPTEVSRRGTARAEDAQGTPTQSHISPSILIHGE